MDDEKIIALWQSRYERALSGDEEQQLNEYLMSHPELAEELELSDQTWQLFEAIERPAPTKRMDAHFEGMLAAYKERKSISITAYVEMAVSWFHYHWKAGLAFTVLGALFGWLLLPTPNSQGSLQQLTAEVQDMKQMMMLTLIEQPKANERLRAVSLATDLPRADQQVIQALISTLNKDENLNVRLASLEALLTYSDNPEVREVLVMSLSMQESPIMQIALADALVALQEKSSVEALQELQESVENDVVKEKLKESITTLMNI